MESFNQRLVRIVTERRSHLCVGLDPDFEKFRETYRPHIVERLRQQPLSFGFVTTADGVAPDARMPAMDQLADEPDIAKEIVCELVIEATREYAAAFKPNAAFFEMVIAGGTPIPEQLRQWTEPVLTIYDGKRGDIGNTSEQYARTIFSEHNYDCVTVNPLMGRDAVEPFLRNPAHGAFLLCLTSNPGADDFLLKNDLYLRIAEKAVAWNQNGNVGLVVGATRPELAAAVREVAPDLPLLIPGVGAQGGALAETLEAVRGRSNPAFVVNASRSVMYARPDDGESILAAAGRAARRLRDEINAVLAG